MLALNILCNIMYIATVCIDIHGREKESKTWMYISVRVLMACANMSLWRANGGIGLDVFDIIIVWGIIISAYFDAVDMQINAVYMITLAIIGIYNICKDSIDTDKVIIIGIIVAVMAVSNAANVLGIADTLAMIAILSIVKYSVESILITLWIGAVGLALHILYRKKHNKGNSAPYIPWLTLGMLLSMCA